jgi:hypothetical protein
MSGKAAILGFALLLVALGGGIDRVYSGEPKAEETAFVARLVHPDRQAAEVLRLFEGARWGDPAATLAAWKQRTGNVAPIGKPAEALIALFNPEMAVEWRAFDDAEIRVGLDPKTGGLEWLAIVPRDDGTVAAGVTAMRLTYPDDRPLAVEGQELPVARLGRSGLPLACHVGTAVVVASSRDLLERGVRLFAAGKGPSRRNEAATADEPLSTASTYPLESGTLLRLNPARISMPGDAPLAERQAIEALHALECRTVEVAASLKDGLLSLDVSTILEARRPGTAIVRPRTVERAWLEALPADRVMAMVSVAIDPEPTSWDRAFAAADRVERVDPGRAGLAPLRTRLNLLAAGAGLKLEADLRPHLYGLTACVFVDPARPGRATGALIVLHLDERIAAERLVRQSAARMGALVGANAPRLPLAIRARERDIWIAWGDAVKASEREDRPDPDHSLAAVCGGWAGEGRRPPMRVGAFWPGRLWQPAGVLSMNPPALRVLADDPPVVWWGWSEPARERDLLRWSGLRQRVRSFLETLQPIPGREAGLTPSPISDSGFKIQDRKTETSRPTQPDSGPARVDPGPFRAARCGVRRGVSGDATGGPVECLKPPNPLGARVSDIGGDV